eukprot:CAMPEP_0198509596 /NCGR_PEP_ID=MMETSP1462-20131121/13662_1 /TAXON_ID=1333877 /ORGANISM="Brandtodinium nutriculum, Strain RCC3387" /LENGTH=41 /DNA_ID= /DNA_START= /DNA_END= /DNA_ORIENTATION=
MAAEGEIVQRVAAIDLASQGFGLQVPEEQLFGPPDAQRGAG